jgi:translocation and assembly module TamA
VKRFLVIIGIAYVSACLASIAAAETRIDFLTPGADKELVSALRSSSLLIQASRDKTEDPQELLAAAQADYARLLGVLYSSARYGGVITIAIDGREAASIPPLAAPNSINAIVVQVDPGPTYLFSEASVAPIATLTELPEGFAPGQPAESDVIGDAAGAAVDGWRAQGHAKAQVQDQRIVARHGENRIAANLRIAPGPKLSFGAVAVEGNAKVRTPRILKIAGLEEGRVYDPEEIDRAVTRLRRTGSFRSVVVEEAVDIGPNDTLPLTIGVVEQTPRRFGFGAEYSTIEGVRLSGFWLHRNFLGGAERFRVDGEIAGLAGETGGVDYSLGARYERPATPRADVDLFATIELEKLDEPDFVSTTGEVTLGFTRYATDKLVVNFGLGYLYSEVTDDFGAETYSLITLPLSGTYVRRDDQLNPKDGYFVDLDVTPFYGLSGTSGGAQIKLDARGYESVGADDRLTFAARVQLGSLFGPALLDSPPFYRFYSGGGGTVRGQDYQSLAIDLGGGNRSGGRSFLGLSGEIRTGVTESIDAVGFLDIGYIGAEAFPDGSGDAHAGAGLGVRYNTGIGPIRLDVATPVYGDADASNFYIYLGIGQAF